MNILASNILTGSFISIFVRKISGSIMRVVFPISEVKRDLKLCKISGNLELVKFIAVVDVNDLGLVTNAMVLKLNGGLELLSEFIQELEPDLFITDDLGEIAEFVVGNGARIAITRSRILEDAFRDLILGRARVIPSGGTLMKYAN